MNTLMTRDEAFDQNLRKYFTGAPCRKGHTSPRYTRNGECCRCHQLLMVKYRRPQHGTKRVSGNVHPADYEMVQAFIDGVIAARNRPTAAMIAAPRERLLAHAATGAAEPPAGRLKDTCPACGEHRDRPQACLRCGWAAIPDGPGWDERVAAEPHLADLPPVAPAPVKPLTGPGAAFAALAATGAVNPFEDC